MIGGCINMKVLAADSAWCPWCIDTEAPCCLLFLAGVMMWRRSGLTLCSLHYIPLEVSK